MPIERKDSLYAFGNLNGLEEFLKNSGIEGLELIPVTSLRQSERLQEKRNLLKEIMKSKKKKIRLN
jgi:hypothetical protein